MLKSVKVRPEGNHFIGCLPSAHRVGVHGRVERTKKAEFFDQCYLEAQMQNIPQKEIVDFIEGRFFAELDFEDWMPTEYFQKRLKDKKRNEHKRIKRYENKLAWVDFNWFVTFTYDSEKETEETFVKRLKKVFSNFKTRHRWLVMAIPEDGSENGRRHYHAFIHIPDGKMVGELFKRKLWSQKKRRWTYVTDNTYFSKRFGYSVWKPINRNDLRGNSLKGYLKKYLVKSGNRFFYSRGIPTEIDMVIDTEKDVFCTYCNYGMKVMLYDHIFFDADRNGNAPVEEILSFDHSEVHGYNLDDYPIVA